MGIKEVMTPEQKKTTSFSKALRSGKHKPKARALRLARTDGRGIMYWRKDTYHCLRIQENTIVKKIRVK